MRDLPTMLELHPSTQEMHICPRHLVSRQVIEWRWFSHDPRLSAPLARANRQVAEVAVGTDTDPESYGPVRLRAMLQIMHHEHRLRRHAHV